MKIKIIKADKPTFWYAADVEATFDVVDRGGKDYILSEDYLLGEDCPWRLIQKSDCVVLNTDREENR